MNNRYLCITTYLALAFVGVAAAMNPVSRSLQDHQGDPNRYVVRIPKDKRKTLYAAVRTKAKSVGGKLNIEVEKKGLIAVTFPPNGKAADAVREYAAENGVTFEHDQVRTLHDIRSSSLRTSRKLAEDTPWGIEKIYEGQGIPALSYYDNLTSKKVCVIDSGYNSNHEDLPDGEVSVGSGNYQDTSVCDYHGSHVSGTIGAIGGNDKGVIGVFPDATGLRVAQVFKSTLFGLICAFVYSSDLIGAVQDCLDNGAEITNMSLGGAGYSAAEDAAFEEFFEVGGMINVASAGNEGPGAISYPGAYSSTMSVGATDINDEIASFSNTNNEVDISAPGVGILSTVGPGSKYDTYDGTSMAAPHVAGAILTLWNTFPGCSNRDVRDALEDGAVDLGAPGRDDKFGNGRLNYWASHDILSATECGGGGGPMPSNSPTTTGLPSASLPVCVPVIIDLTTDDWPSETTWLLTDSKDSIISQNPLLEENDGTTTTICLPVEDECYKFEIFDSYSDGVCCSFGGGEVTVTFDGTVVLTAGAFGSSESVGFCVGGVPVIIDLKTDNYASETTWFLTDSNDSIISQNPQLETNDQTTTTINLPVEDTCYKFEIFDSFGDGICCSYGEGEVTVTFDGTVILTAGSFGSGESVDFCVGGPSSCIDSILNIAGTGGEGCAFVANNQENCDLDTKSSHCPLSCNSCDEFGCVDSTASFESGGRTYTCGVLASLSDSQLENYCLLEEVYSTCRGTCSTCNL